MKLSEVSHGLCLTVAVRREQTRGLILEMSIAEVAKLARIEVRESAFARIQLQIGTHRLPLTQDRTHVRLRAELEKGIVSAELD